MRAAIRYLHSPDIPDLVNFSPEVEDCFGFLLQVIAGPEDGEGEESFDIVVVTPAWLLANRKTDIVIGRHYLIVFKYDFPALRDFISRYASRCFGATWDEVAQQLGRLGRWEFEDYIPAP